MADRGRRDHAFDDSFDELGEVERRPRLTPGKRTLTASIPAVQFLGPGPADGTHAQAIADEGLEGSAAPLPHLGTIQQAFGKHDVGNVQAHTDEAASRATALLRAEAYAFGTSVAFAQSSPALHTAAHEAAHVVQQRAGLAPAGGVGSPGDAYERQADAVAEAVVGGGSAEPLLDQMIGGPGATTAVQSKGLQLKTEVGGGVEVTQQSIEVAFNFTPKKEISGGYAKVVFSTPVAVKGALKAKNEAPVNVGGEGKSNKDRAAKVSVEVWKDEAKAAGASKFAELAYKDIDDAGYAVDKVEWENELGIGEGEKGSKVGVATGVKFTFKNGNSQTVKAQLFEKEAGVGMSGPKLELEHTFKFPSKTLWENKSAELVVGGEVKLKAEVQPNWEKIFMELAKQGGKEVAKNFIRSALTAITGEMLIGGALVAGAALTVLAAVKEMQAIQAIKECTRAAQNALAGYVHGYCISWGVEEFGNDGSTDWFMQGIKDGRGKLYEQIKKIQNHPVFKPWNFTEDELRVALKQKLKQHGGAVYRQVEGGAKTKIFTEYVVQFYHKRKAEWLTTAYMARKDAIWVARSLGIDESVVPEE